MSDSKLAIVQAVYEKALEAFYVASAIFEQATPDTRSEAHHNLLLAQVNVRAARQRVIKANTT